MEETILRSKVFEILQSSRDTSQAFDLVWITADRRRGTGGEIISAESWMVVSDQANSGNSRNSNNSVPGAQNSGSVTSKDPNHPENGTVNVFNPANSGVHPHKVHYDLIQFFNGKRVIN